MKQIKFGKLSIDAVSYGSQGSAVLGIRDSGKTYTATLLAERLFDAGIPFIAFDPIGVWRFLRVPGTGRGYPVVVAGGQEGDLPLTVASAPEIVRAAMRNGVSLVIDLFDINLSKADWKQIVMACVRVLLHENASHGLRHVFIEEAAEFAPQRVGPDQGQVYAEIEKLGRMGGNSRLGYTLINQRAEEVNKAVLENCDNLFLHRQKGRNSLTALSKWLDIGNVKDHREIIETLSTLPTGECWAWLAGTDRPVLVKVPDKNSLHPDRRVMRGADGVKNKAAVDVGAFVQTMKATLITVEAELQANDPIRLKAEIAKLKREISTKPLPDRDTIDEAERRGYGVGYGRGKVDGYADAVAGAQAECANMLPAIEGVAAGLKNLRATAEQIQAWATQAIKNPPKVSAVPPMPTPQPKLHTKPQRQPQDDATISPTVRKILDEIHRANPVALTFEAASLRTGVSRRSSAYRSYKQQVEASAEVERRSDGRFHSAPGYAAPIDTGVNPIDAFASRLPPSYAGMLRAIAASSSPLTRDQIAEAANVSPTSSGLASGLRELMALSLIEKHGESYALHRDLAA